MSVASTLKQTALLFFKETAAERSILLGINRGVKMYLDLKTDTQTHLGLAELELANHFRKLSQGIKTAIDVGAAQGYYTLFFLTKTSANRVLTFEPEREARERLEMNLRINCFNSNARCIQSSKLVGSVDNATTTTLDSFYENTLGPCLIKIDVEEAELDVLAGSQRFLQNKDVRWLVETHTPELEKQCLTVFESYGKKTKIIDKAWWRAFLPEQRPRPHNRWLIAY